MEQLADWIKVIILGVVEGVTEFLPVSSTGHLIIATDLLNFDSVPHELFEIFIQFGAVVAVFLYYAPDLWRELLAVRNQPPARKFWVAVIIATIPAGVLGLAKGDEIQAVLFNPTVVALAMIIGGIAFCVVEYMKASAEKTKITAAKSPHVIPTADAITPPPVTTPPTVNWWQALVIGIFQTIALIPGMSRSGMSILGGMAVGLNREAATRFSFYLAIPLLGGATLHSLIKALPSLSSQSLVYLIVGAVISGIIAWLSIGWLLGYISKHSFTVFGVYRIVVGVIILVMVIARIL